MDSLYFGTARRGGEVSPEDWRQFLAAVVTPRFPDGLTSWTAAGQWRDASGGLQRESAYVLYIVHLDARRDDVAIAEVVRLYKERFEQQAVLRVRTPACVSF
jgi:hypothetical protein